MGKGLRMSLRELRAYTRRTQVEAAAENEMTQSELSRLERREDFLLSTLRRYVDSLGGKLEVRVMLGSSEFVLTDTERPVIQGDPKSVGQAIEALGSIEEWLPPLIEGLSLAELRERRVDCGTFSLLEHLWHLYDLDEIGYLVRMRRTLEEERPSLPDLLGDRLAVERAYQKREVEPARTALSGARRKAVARLRKLSEKQFRREAILEGAGTVTLADLVLRWRAHDLGHRVEMERLSAALRD
jgi:hypothetical protein